MPPQPPLLTRSLAVAIAFPVAVGVLLSLNRAGAPPPEAVAAVSDPATRAHRGAWADAIDLMDAAFAAETAYADAAIVDETSLGESRPAAAATSERTGPAFHTVQSGDTLERIATQFGSSVSELATANSLSDPDFIQAGRILSIPGKSSLNATSADRSPRASVGTVAALPERTPRNAEEAFIFQVAPGARVSQQETGVPSSVTIAQAILESFWGTSYLAREANNLFGVKAHSKPGPAGVTWIDAWEVEDGRDVTRREPFRKYNSVAESIRDHGHFFVENSRYRSALLAADDPKEFARRINSAGYATDPAYASKLISYMDRYDLYQYDIR